MINPERVMRHASLGVPLSSQARGECGSNQARTRHVDVRGGAYRSEISDFFSIDSLIQYTDDRVFTVPYFTLVCYRKSSSRLPTSFGNHTVYKDRNARQAGPAPGVSRTYGYTTRHARRTPH